MVFRCIFFSPFPIQSKSTTREIGVPRRRRNFDGTHPVTKQFQNVPPRFRYRYVTVGYGRDANGIIRKSGIYQTNRLLFSEIYSFFFFLISSIAIYSEYEYRFFSTASIDEGHYLEKKNIRSSWKASGAAVFATLRLSFAGGKLRLEYARHFLQGVITDTFTW